VLSMCIRATDYLPPVDPTFSDFLRAMVTADFELNRADDSGLRAAMIEAFRQRGIRPEAVGSLAVQSLLLEAEDKSGRPDATLSDIVSRLLDFGARQLARSYPSVARVSTEKKRRRPSKLESPAQWIVQQNRLLAEPSEIEVTEPLTPEEEPEEALRQVAKDLAAWAKQNRDRLKLDPELPVAVRGFHPVHRIASTGELLVEMVAHFVQTRRSDDDLGGLKYRAGTTLVANIDGYVRYVIHKPFHEQREKSLREWVAAFDEANGTGWPSESRDPNRIVTAFSARAMDRRRWR
jgi:hypothetical protein